MKIIVDRTSSVVKYHLPDWAFINLTEQVAEISDSEDREPSLFFPDINSSNAVTYDNVDLPGDYRDNKYTYNGTVWTMVEGWVDPPRQMPPEEDTPEGSLEEEPPVTE